MTRIPEPSDEVLSNPSWLGLAFSRPVVVRASAYMVVVGGVLIAINHGDAIFRGEFDGARVIKMLMTPLVPYVVSTLSSVSALRGVSGASSRSATRRGT